MYLYKTHQMPRRSSRCCYLVAFFFLLSFISASTLSQEITQTWSVSPNIGSGVSVGANDIKIVGGAGGSLHFIEGDGVVRSQSLAGDVAGTAAIGPNGNIFIGDYSGIFYSFTPDMRQQLWSFDAGSEIFGSPAISLGGAIYFGTKEGVFYALDSLSGKELWQFNTGSKIGGSAAVGPLGNVYFGTESGHLYGLDGKTGQVVFQYGAGGGVTSPALDWKGNLYFGTFGNEVVSLTPFGDERWRVVTDGVVSASPVVSEDGTVVFASFEPGTLYVVDPGGNQIGKASLGASNYGSPALTTDNKIFVSTVDGRVQSWEFSAGELVETSEMFLDGPIYAPITISNPSTLLLTTQQGTLYEIALSSENLSQPQWPMFGLSSVHQRVFPNLDLDRCPDATDLYPSDGTRCYDQDEDGTADVNDSDRDGDGLSNEYEIANGLNPDLFDEDVDGDGYLNSYELEQGLDPLENEFDDRSMEVVGINDSLGSVAELAIAGDGQFIVVGSISSLVVFERNAETGGLAEASRVSEPGLNVERIYAVDSDIYSIGSKMENPAYSQPIETREFRHYRISEVGEAVLAQTLTMQSWENGMTMEPGVLYDGSSGAVSSFAVSPNGDQVYLGTGNRGIVIFDRDTATGALTFREHYMNGGTSFGAGGGLVMTEDGSRLFAQFGSEQWLLNRSVDGSLSSGQLLHSSLSTKIHKGMTADNVMYLGARGFFGRPILESDADNRQASILSGSSYGWLFANQVRGLGYRYEGNSLKAYYRDGDSLVLLDEISSADDERLGSWTRALTSSDGRYIYAASSNGRLTVLKAGFKGQDRPDRDGDGVEDIMDAFPDDPTESVDTDHDGIGNNTDNDDDQDGVTDDVDAFPLDASEWLDTDGDGVGNNQDDDDDQDGYMDASDQFPLDATEWVDADSDGLGDNADLDDDDDGMSDTWEVANNLNPYNASDATLNPDGDGLTNLEEFQNDSDPVLSDTDGDGYLDDVDEMPRDPLEYRDFDGDGIGDTADTDDDNDGLSDTCEAKYGFEPLIANPEGQDSDQDGVTDDLECAAGTSPLLVDSDGDGLPDDFELAFGLDALRDDANEDLDGDGYPNSYEYTQGLNPAENEFDDRPVEVIEAHESLSDATELAITGNGQFVVVESGFNLVVFERNAETGELTEVSRMSEFGLDVDRLYAVGSDIYSVGTKTTGSGYSPSIETREVRRYRVSDVGDLALVQTLTMQSWENGMTMEPGVLYDGSSGAVSSFAVSPNGDQVYLGTGNRGIVIFDRDTATGALTFREHYMNGGTSFGAGGGLVMTEDGSRLFAQFGSEQWLLQRAPDGSLSPGQQLPLDQRVTIHEGTLVDRALYLGVSQNMWVSRPLVEVDDQGGTVSIASGLSGSSSGLALSNPRRKIAYSYYSGELRAFYRGETGLVRLDDLNSGEDVRVDGWSRWIVSPDGQHIYATSFSNNRLIVLKAGFKGMGHPDTDGDGIADFWDAFPDDPTESVDTDHDGIGNNTDNDDDQDGVTDDVDAFPLDASEWLDTDGDGVGNNQDDDDDQDGYMDASDQFPLDATEWVDADSDGLGDNADLDDDDDGMSDTWEVANNLNPYNASDATLNPDGDGLTNLEEFQNDSDPVLSDTDGDGYLDDVDEMPRDPLEYRDFDGDGIGDTADTDDDNDGLSDTCEAKYGFEPLIANPEGQDSDQDGVTDDLECAAGTSPLLVDSDGDGLPDDFELAFGLDALRDDANEDLDGDGYPNSYEYTQGLNPAENEFDDRPVEVIEAHESLSDATELAITGNGQFVVVESGFNLVVFERNAETGELTEVSRMSEFGLDVDRLYAVGSDIYSVGTKTTGSGYSPSIETREVRRYRVSDVGDLALVQTLTMQSWENGMTMEPGVLYDGSSGAVSSFAVSPNGDQVYLGTGNRGIVIFDRDTATGALTFREHYMNGGTSFGAGGGLVMTEDGSRLFAQFGSEQWLLQRAPDGSLSPGQQLPLDQRVTIHEGTLVDRALYLGVSQNMWVSRPLVEVDDQGGTVSIASGLSGSSSGLALSNPRRKIAYSYYSGELRAFYRGETGLVRLDDLNSGEDVRVDGWSRWIVSPDGQHIYATSFSNNRLIVLKAGFKGMGHPDTDGDGIADKDDAFPFDPTEWMDSDGDGVGDNSDVFPRDPTEWADFDGDTLGDNSDPDIDGDGCLNADDQFDFNAQECLDTDSDGVGNNGDDDDDGDRLPDDWEISNGLNPLDPSDASSDLDGDGLSNEDEYHVHQTLANQFDSDGDGMDDGWEVASQLDPTDQNDAQLDLDGDGFSSIEEYTAETDPNDPRWYPGAPGLAKWIAQSAGAIRTRAAVDPNGTSYVGSDDGHLYAFDSEGVKLWSVNVGSPVRSSPVLLPDGTLVLGTGGGDLLKIDPVAPSEPKVLTTVGGAISTSVEVSGLGYIYFGSADGSVYSVNAVTGQKNWEYDTGAPVNAAPRLGNDGVIYIGTDGGEFHAIHAETGAPVN